MFEVLVENKKGHKINLVQNKEYAITNIFEEQKIRNRQRVEEDKAIGLKRKCSMCGEVKSVSEYRMINKTRAKSGVYSSYCSSCEKLYRKEYMRIYRERKRTEKIHTFR